MSGSLILSPDAIAANRTPTIDNIPNYGPILENAGIQIINLTGIGPGRNESDQTVSITAISDNESLIDKVDIDYDLGEIATLSFTPVQNTSGKAKITVILDDGEDKRNIKRESFTVTVAPVNGQPIFQLSKPVVVVDENTGKVEIKNFAIDIDDGDPDEQQDLEFISTVLLLDGNLSFITEPEISSKDGDLVFECNQDVFGEALIAVVLEDDGGTTNGGIDVSDAANFTIQVNPLDPPPIIDEVDDYGPILENAGVQQIRLRGIGPGGDIPGQTVSIDAWTDNEDLISNIAIEYDHGETALLSFFTAVDLNGIATITVAVSDGQSTVEESFVVTVVGVNGKPSFELSSELISIEESVGRIEIANFAVNIDDGDPGEKQELKFITSVQEITGDLSFLSLPQINSDNGDLDFECKPELYGEALISVVLEDDGGNENAGEHISDIATFIIKIGAINSPPTLDIIPGPITILEDSGEQLVQLTGISSGKNEELQELSILASSDKLELISELQIEYQQGSDTAQLRFVSKPNLFGVANITISVDDGQTINNQIIRKFFVVVNPVADTPEVTEAIIQGSNQSISGLEIFRNPIDGDEVTHFKITNIQQGNLFLHDGVTETFNDTFITYSEGNEGLKFTIADPYVSGEIFNVQAATGPSDDRLGGDIVPATILVNNDPPTIVSIPDSVIEISDSFVYNLKAEDSDEEDVLVFKIEIPEQIESWLKIIEDDDGTPTIFGTPPLEAIGIYVLKIRVEDRVGAFDEQVFNLTVNERNNRPELLPVSIEIKEDEVFYFEKDHFVSSFYDEDGDTLYSIKAANLPEFGSLFLNDILIDGEIEVESDDIQNLSYIPNQDYFGFDVFDWSASDAKDFALIPKRVRILISSVNDAPEIFDFEEDGFVFEFGDENVPLTNTAYVVDVDNEKLVKAEISFTNGYSLGEDSLYYELIEDLNFEWKDSVGILYINGVSPTAVYQEAIRSVKYVNIDRLSPSGDGRDIEIVLFDSDTSSLPYKRQIFFEDNFEELEIPNAFTPNGDNANDRWGIENIDKYGDYDISIYSKTGERIFESTAIKRQWDGTHNGKLVPVGSYYYVIKIDKFQKTYSGTVLVLK